MKKDGIRVVRPDLRALAVSSCRVALGAAALAFVQLVVTPTDIAPYLGIASAAAQDEKKQQETRKTPALRNKVYEKLAEAQTAAEAKDLATAAKILDGMLAGRRDNELNSYELANVYNLYAFVHYSREDYGRALGAYENVVSQPDIPLAMEINTRYTIAQLYFVQEQWQQGVNALLKWFDMTQSPNANAYVLLSQGYYQLKQFDKALDNIEIAIADYDDRGKIPKENWYNLARFLHAERDDQKATIDILEKLITFYPKKDYWVQLSYMYSEQNRSTDQLGALETAYVQDMLEKDGEYRSMASLFLNAEVPWKAAQVLREGFDNEIVEDNSKNWELLAGSLRQAQEVQAAIPAMKKAAEKSDDGELYARLGSIYLDAERYDDAIEAVTKGLQRGGVKRPDQARLVLGMAHFNKDQYQSARQAFRAAGRDERSEQYARQWIRYMDSEIERQEKLAAEAQAAL